jgi:hypothetical protein
VYKSFWIKFYYQSLSEIVILKKNHVKFMGKFPPERELICSSINLLEIKHFFEVLFIGIKHFL